ncbi:MAG: hypothetical protein IJN50_01070 [Clostridia bacterium]|nr:hypothetical protein [Clostridia bacterium]
MKIKELTEYKSFIEKQLKQTYPEPKTNEFIVMARYNNMIESIVEEYVLNKINENRTLYVRFSFCYFILNAFIWGRNTVFLFFGTI